MKRLAACLVLATTAFGLGAFAQTSGDERYFSELRWRLVGPHRAGRLWSVAGVPGDPATYYAGTPAGALWKSTNGGTTWASISDALPATGIGAFAVAASNSQILYAGTGNNTLGAGVFRSDDAGATWRAAGLADTKFIAGLLIDPTNPDIVIVAAGAGGNFGSMVFYNNNPSAARGVYRTADGGKTWAHTLFVDNATSAVDLAMDPSTPNVILASLSNGLHRSTDGGHTWTKLPATGLGAVGTSIAIAPGSKAQRVYTIGGGRGGGGLFRSDDGGETFRLMTSRLASAGGRLVVDPKNADIVYTMGTSMYRSVDGGKTLDAIKGAPGGDDAHALWIDPTNPRRMFAGFDQGPTISLNGGASWTPWYTMPNGEFYFLSTDNQFPYRIYAAQQDSGTVSILSRGDFGAIRPQDWYPVSGYEQGHIFTDPLNARYVYSHGGGHVITRYDRVTGQSGPVFTPAADDRFGPRPGMDLSPKDPRWMFVGSQFVYASNDRVTWTRISGDLAVRADRSTPNAPAGNNGTITAIAASPVDANILWVGTSNGLVQVTRDMGKTWTKVAPTRLSADANLTVWSMEASSHDAGTAYVGAIDLSDAHGPALFMTNDFGATWKEITAGLPKDVPTRAVREDPKQATLLYAATQHGVFVSFDRGGAWRPLQQNLPPVAVNDLTIHGDDLIAATWGRGIWALDNVTPLRQIAAVRASANAPFLFEPATAIRVRWDNNQDTPLPPEVPQGQNPPDGVAIDYYLPGPTAGAVTLSIHDQTGALVRQYTHATPPPDTRMPNVPAYWFKTPATTSTAPGMHRLVWDLRYATPPALDFGADGTPANTVSFGIIAPAIIGETSKQQPLGSLVLPGTYEVRLNAGGQTLTRKLTVTNDPRSEATIADLTAQLAQERRLSTGIETIEATVVQVNALRSAAHAAELLNTNGALAAPVAAFNRAASTATTALTGARGLAGQLANLEFADLKPTASTIAAVDALCKRADDGLAKYREFIQKDLAAMNTALTASGQKPLAAPATIPATACGPSR
jgi:photosystem II stability/assembly factor-like uncharacterized protein